LVVAVGDDVLFGYRVPDAATGSCVMFVTTEQARVVET
jgi:hypothetical protein